MSAVRPLLLAGLVFSLASAARPADESTRAADEAALREARVGTDGPSLLTFFRKRTLSPDDQARLADTVRKLGDNVFAVREQATRDLCAAGRAALPYLRTARNDADLEVARRAERCLHDIENGPGTALTLAALRLTALDRPDGAAEALLAYLPFADDETVEEEVLTSLAAVGVRDGQVDRRLKEALKDAEPARRAAAAWVLGRTGERDKVRPLLRDADHRVKLRAAQGLVLGHDPTGVPSLVALLEDGPLPLAWRAEELLCRLAGERAPRVSVGSGDAPVRKQCRLAWDQWWQRHADTLDLARLDLEERALGLTLLVVYDGYANGQGRIWEFGADRRPRWQIDADIQGPIDAEVLPGNRLLLAEYNARRVSERDLKGKILWEHQVNGNPVSCQRLGNGNTFIATLNQVLEVSADGKPVYSHMVPNNQVTFARKLRNGNIMHISSNGMLVEMDEKGKVIKSLKVGGNNTEWLTFEVLPGGRVRVPQQSHSKLVEYDAAGKVVWEGRAPHPYSATKLPNGNVLACSMNDSKVYEVDPTGKVVWEEQLQGRPFHVSRR